MQGTSTDSVGILELGCGTDPDPRSDLRLDIREMPAADVVHNLEEIPWPFEDESVEGVIARHVVEHLHDPSDAIYEIARILQPGGWAEVRVPFGLGWWYRDPTHKNHWTYDTPLYFAGDDAEGEYFYYDLPLELAERRFEKTFLNAPGLSKLSPLFRWLTRRYPGQWVCGTPWACGEIVVTFEKTVQ